MGSTESVCTLDPAISSYYCAASTVQIPAASSSLYENYELGVYKGLPIQTATYTFDCIINEQTLFGKVYCDGIGKKVTVSCGNDSRKF